MSLITMSDANRTPGIVLLEAPEKSGKTGTSATISKLCPEILPAKEKVVLSDILYWQYDPNGVETLAHLNLSAPVIDFSPYLDDFTKLQAAEKAALDETKKLVADKMLTALVVDTISMRNVALNYHFGKVYADPKATGPLYKAILAKHMDFVLRMLLPLQIPVILNCHTKFSGVMFEDNNGTAEKRKIAQSLPGSAEIVADITGAGGSFIKRTCSGVFSLVCKREKGKPDKFTIRPKGNAILEGGNRWANLDEEEPANLRTIFKKAGVL